MRVGDRVWYTHPHTGTGEEVTVKRINRKTITVENSWLQVMNLAPEALRPLAEVAEEQGWNWMPDERGH